MKHKRPYFWMITGVIGLISIVLWAYQKVTKKKLINL